MPTRNTALAALIAGGSTVAAIVFLASAPRAQSLSGTALSGVVSSPEEGRMEGVVVSARREGSNVMVSVVSDAKGTYSFPRSHLAAGKYALVTRAVGYDLANPGAVDVSGGKAATQDLKLGKTKDLGVAAVVDGVGDEHARDRGAEGQAGLPAPQLRLLPYRTSGS